MSYIGALLIVAVGFAMGLQKAREVRQKAKALRGVCFIIEAIGNEIVARKTPLIDIFAMLSVTAPIEVRSFCKAIKSGFNDLGEMGFCEIWSEAVSGELILPSEESTAALKEVGASLGRYDAELQKAALDRALMLLTNELSSYSAFAKANEKMYIALGGGISMIAVLMLI